MKINTSLCRKSIHNKTTFKVNQNVKNYKKKAWFRVAPMLKESNKFLKDSNCKNNCYPVDK